MFVIRIQHRVTTKLLDDEGINGENFKEFLNKAIFYHHKFSHDI